MDIKCGTKVIIKVHKDNQDNLFWQAILPVSIPPCNIRRTFIPMILMQTYCFLKNRRDFWASQHLLVYYLVSYLMVNVKFLLPNHLLWGCNSFKNSHWEIQIRKLDFPNILWLYNKLLIVNLLITFPVRNPVAPLWDKLSYSQNFLGMHCTLSSLGQSWLMVVSNTYLSLQYAMPKVRQSRLFKFFC